MINTRATKPPDHQSSRKLGSVLSFDCHNPDMIMNRNLLLRNGSRWSPVISMICSAMNILALRGASFYIYF